MIECLGFVLSGVAMGAGKPGSGRHYKRSRGSNFESGLAMKKLCFSFTIICLVLTCALLAARSESARGHSSHLARNPFSVAPCLMASTAFFFQCGGDPPCDLGEGPNNGPCSPIILDLSGNGFFLTNAQNGVQFDISGDGALTQIAWTALGSDNAFLALPGSDGLVHNGKELFGNFTPQPASAHPNGFAALAVYDQSVNGGNGDGIIDARDKNFSSLRLWVDSNHDGICQPEELFTLPSKGVNSISLNYHLSMRRDQFGNLFRYRSRVDPDGRADRSDVGRTAYDVFLTTAN
jgi:hypothetical protein